MPIYVTVYHLDRIIVGKTEGRVTLADLEGYFDAIVKARAVSYSKIFDATSGTSTLNDERIGVFRERMREFVARGKVGPLAVVTGAERHGRLANICQTLATAERPMRVFADISTARQWLAQQAPVEDDPPEQVQAGRTAAG